MSDPILHRSETSSPRTVLVTGATGYIGGRLVPRLLENGFHVRCVGRSLRKLQARPWANHPRVTLIETDAADEDRLTEALRGCEAMYYLVHSMLVAGDEYAEVDRRLAHTAARSAERAQCDRIIYLGGLGEEGGDLSRHLSSRRQVEECLREGAVPVTVLRAAMIIGSGSASFEILRYLVERLPIMITPRWVKTLVQPIAIANVLEYLVQCLNTPETTGKTLDIGGPDVVPYRTLIDDTARALELPKRIIIPVPVLTPRLSSLWIHLVTPISAHIARPLAEGLRNEVVCRNDEAARLMPQQLLSARDAIEKAVSKSRLDEMETSWADAGVMPGDPDWAGGRVYTDCREIGISATAEEVFRAICRLGGKNGYYSSNWLWRLRGAMDRFIGGPGLRRGRRHPDTISFGDALDFWRVTDVVQNELLELRAEMRLPGVATLTFEIHPVDESPESPRCRLVQTARFKPRGLLGLLYWYMVVPLHGLAFTGMLRGIRDKAVGAKKNSYQNQAIVSGVTNSVG